MWPLDRVEEVPCVVAGDAEVRLVLVVLEEGAERAGVGDVLFELDGDARHVVALHVGAGHRVDARVLHARPDLQRRET